jgi:hypothetical protein
VSSENCVDHRVGQLGDVRVVRLECLSVGGGLELELETLKGVKKTVDRDGLVGIVDEEILWEARFHDIFEQIFAY